MAVSVLAASVALGGIAAGVAVVAKHLLDDKPEDPEDVRGEITAGAASGVEFELFHNIDGPDGSAILPHAQPVIATIIPVLDDGDTEDLLSAVAGTADPDPQSSAAGDRAIERADHLAKLASPADLEAARREVISDRDDGPLPPITRSSRFLAEALQWVDPAVQVLAPASAVTTITVALGVSGPAAVILGATLGLLW